MTRYADLSPPSIPPNWPRAATPRRVAILGWARLGNQWREGSGYNYNASELAGGLVLSGHRVFYLRSGMDYALFGGPRTRFLEVWRGVECYDLINSRNLSPASSNFRNMDAELSSPRDSALVIEWLDQIKADVVHIHSLEGFALDLIKLIRESGRPVVVTPHNYWYACPQVDLLHEEKRVCDDYQGGNRCVDCLEAPAPHRARRNRAVNQTLHKAFGHFAFHVYRMFYDHAKFQLKKLRGKVELPPEPKPVDWPELSDELAAPFDQPASGIHAEGRIDHGIPVTAKDKGVDIGVMKADTNESFLASDRHLVVLNNYGKRRLAGIAALNAASLVTPPSRFLLEVMHAMGLKRELGRHVRLGQPHFDVLNRRIRRSPYYDRRPWTPSDSRPLRFGFMGTTRNNKGLEVLTRAIPLLAPEVRARCHFIIHAAGYDWPFRKRLNTYPEVSFLSGYDHLQMVAAMGEFDVGILPHIWFENSPLVLLEFLHAGKFVISSRLGGPPDWIVEPSERSPGNGLLFPAGNAEELAARISRLATGQTAVPSPHEIHAVSTLQGYPDHVAELTAIYESLISGSPTPPVATRPAHATEPALT